MENPILDEPTIGESPTENPSNLPSLVARIKALVVDFIIMLFVFAVSSVVIDSIGGVSDFIKGTIAVSMLILYDPVLTAFTGSTLGHKLMHLKVRRNDDHESNISIIHAFIRFFTKATLGWLSFITVTTNTNKRAIHDMIGGSIVVY